MSTSTRATMGMEIQSLEQRLMFAVTPATPRADSLGTIFDKTERQDLLGRLTHLSATEASTLQTKLSKSVGQFDTELLNYMRSRSGPKFFIDPANFPATGKFVSDNNLDITDETAHANAIIQHLFPEQGSSGDYTVQLGASINFIAPGGSTNPEFLHEMNRMEWLRELPWVNATTPNASYASELEYELAQWSSQFTTVGTPKAFSASDQDGWLLDSALRVESWTWSYFGFLDDPNFTAAEDSLFLYKFAQEADYLYAQAVSPSVDLSSNKTIVLGKALLYMGELFPEMDDAATWTTTARSLLFNCMDAQIYDDGSHVEQSPGYAYNVSNDLLDSRQIDAVNGISWPKHFRTKLSNIIDSYWQELSPNGKRPAIGDSYRNQSIALFTKPDLILGTTRWPLAKPAARDVFVAGIAAVTPVLNSPTKPSSLGARGKTYAMVNSGNYVMRSGDDTAARQINFDAGPKGGSHGHYDLLNFELSGYGRPLISDPGAYLYDKSANRAYVVSTQAHNTINIDGQNTAALEGSPNPNIIVSQWRTGTDYSQITATHYGYKSLAGSPVVTRSLWYDLDGTIVIVDWGQGSAKHNYQESFNLQTLGVNSNVTSSDGGLSAQTNYSDGGNVKISAVTGDSGETGTLGDLTFVTNTVGGTYMDPAYRYTLNESGKFVVMITLITTYAGTTAPDTTATLLGTPTENGPVMVQLTKNGVSQTIDFARPALGALDSTATTRGTYNDIAYDSAGNLHQVYADRDTGNLMYTSRSTAGKWSTPITIDPAFSSDPAGGYQYISVAIDSTGKPAVAYFDGWNGDLKFAAINPTSGKWFAETLDKTGSVGLYPSLAFGRSGEPTISYYDHTNKDLKLASATSNTGAFSTTRIDTTGDVGRFSSLMLDPNRKTLTRWAVGYEDTSNGNYKYAIQGGFDGGTQANGYTNYTVDDLPDAGGYLSLAFYDSGTNDSKRYKPAMSYYDASQSGLRYAKSTDGGATWSADYVTGATKGIQGLYTQLIFDNLGQAQIFFFDRTNNEARRAILNSKGWTVTDLRAGGREMHVSQNAAGNVAYSSLNEATGLLNVFTI